MTNPEDDAVQLYRGPRVEAGRLDELTIDDLHNWLVRLGVPAVYADRSATTLKFGVHTARRNQWIVAFDENNINVIDEIEFQRNYVRENRT